MYFLKKPKPLSVFKTKQKTRIPKPPLKPQIPQSNKFLKLVPKNREKSSTPTNCQKPQTLNPKNSTKTPKIQITQLTPQSRLHSTGQSQKFIHRLRSISAHFLAVDKQKSGKQATASAAAFSLPPNSPQHETLCSFRRRRPCTRLVIPTKKRRPKRKSTQGGRNVERKKSSVFVGLIARNIDVKWMVIFWSVWSKCLLLDECI